MRKRAIGVAAVLIGLVGLELAIQASGPRVIAQRMLGSRPVVSPAHTPLTDAASGSVMTTERSAIQSSAQSTGSTYAGPRRATHYSGSAGVAGQSFSTRSVVGQHGVTIKVADDPNFSALLAATLDHLASLGVNSLGVIVSFVQTAYNSSDPQISTNMPTAAELQTLITMAHQRGMSVMLRPLMDDANLCPPPKNPCYWRGTVDPTTPSTWFNTYTNQVLLKLIQSGPAQADIVSVGSELTTLQYKYPDMWTNLINVVRANFSGTITYSSNWDWANLPNQSQPYPSFAPSLDFLGIDAFYPLNGINNASSVSQFIQAWQPIMAGVSQLSAYYRKPVAFTEIGLASQDGTLTQPWNSISTAPADLATQQTYYAAACRAARPQRIGLYWWFYNGLYPPLNPLTDNSFTPYGKPAEQEVAACYLTR